MATLAERVEQEDYTAQLEARARGDAALPELEPLLAHAEPEVRELAVHCVVEAGGDRVADLLLPRLHDPEEQVAMAALRGLERYAEARHVGALLGVYDAGVDPELAPGLVLLIGRFPASLVPHLRSGGLHQRARAAPDPATRDAWQAVLVRLGDDDAQRAFVGALRSATGEALRVLLERCAFVGGPWLLPALDPVLDDLTPLVRVGIDGRPDLIDALRARELAMLAIDAIARAHPALGFSPSFPISRAVHYDDAQAAEVQPWLRGLPRPPAIYGPAPTP